MCDKKPVFFSIQLGEIEISLRVKPVWGNTPQNVWWRAERISSGHTVWSDLTKGGKREWINVRDEFWACKRQLQNKKQSDGLDGLLRALFALFMMISGQSLCRRSFSLQFLVEIKSHESDFNSVCLCSPVCFHGYSSKIWILIPGLRPSLQNTSTFIKWKCNFQLILFLAYIKAVWWLL